MANDTTVPTFHYKILSSYCFRDIAVVSLDRVRIRVTFRLIVSQSVSLGVVPRLGLMTRYLFVTESYSPVHMGRPL
jgi:hypothetical protein